MKRAFLRLSASLLLLATLAAAQPAAKPAYDDAVLRAMSAEMERSQAQLRLEQMDRPYYIEYNVSDIDEYSVNASFGALRLEQRNRLRLARVVVRVGSYQQDSYFAGGQGVADLMPIDDDELALRHQLWLATDQAYKNALEAYTVKQAMLKEVVVETELADFSREQPLQSIRPLARLKVDPQPWRDLVRSVSAQFLRDPGIHSSEASVVFRVVNRYFMNSEGTVSRRGQQVYMVYFGGGTQAPDGMRLERSKDYTVGRIEELPPPEQVRNDADTLIGTLAALRNAPVVDEEYRGPVLFTGDGAATLVSRLIAPNIAGMRPQPGSPARTSGDYATHLKSRVLPEFLSVVDDPTVEAYQGRSLLGAYDVDEEGVKAQPVTVVENGRLLNYLLGRQPIRDFPSSNGHGRASPGGIPTPHIGNLFLRAREGKSVEELTAQMLEICREQDRPYGYVVETAGPELEPRLFYRVWVEDGRRELVRGAVFGHLDIRALRSDILAAGSDAYIENRHEPVSRAIVTPSLLFGELEVRPSSRTRERPPDYPPPAAMSTARN